MSLIHEQMKAKDDFILSIIARGHITVDTNGNVYRSDGSMYRPHENKGYLNFNLLDPDSGVSKTVRHHKVVWLALNGQIQAGLFINHKNEDKTDNSIANLELVTHGQNIAHRSPSKAKRLTDEDVLFMFKLRKSGWTGVEIHRQYFELNHYNTINDAICGKTFKHLESHRQLAA